MKENIFKRACRVIFGNFGYKVLALVCAAITYVIISL